MTPTIAEINQQVRSGERSALAVLEETLTRIHERNPRLNAFTAVTETRARLEASAVDARRARGETLGPLAGVPYAVKNLFDVEGMSTLAGGRINAGNDVATQDASVVARLREVGAVLVGTLNMDEHAYGFTTENTYYGATRNPHDATCVAGGSSGGSGAAVAAGMVPLTLGTDTNGSIRVPASLCGVFGLKPSFGRLPRRGAFPFAGSLDHVGPLAAHARDLAAAYDAMQGPDDSDPSCRQRPIEPTLDTIAARPDGARIAVLGGYFERCAGAQARAAVNQAARALGATAHVELPGVDAARAAAFILTAAEGGALHRERLIDRYDEFEPLSRDRLVAGSLVPANWVVQALRIRQQFFKQVMALFETYDLLLAAATPIAAAPIGAEWLELDGQSLPLRPSMGLLTQPISFIGLPVCVAPIWPAAGSRPDLPLGVQLIAAPWRENVCLAAAHALEAEGVAEFRVAN
jgi:AtzE family amidohydrolase